MRKNRLFVSDSLSVAQQITLNRTAAHHLRTVLRARVGDICYLFNNSGFEYTAKICQLDKKQLQVVILQQQQSDCEPQLYIHLFLPFITAANFDFALQKACELGASEITPIFCSRAKNISSAKVLANKKRHWQQVIIHACQQSWRSKLVKLNSPLQFTTSIINSAQTKIIPCTSAVNKTSILDLPASACTAGFALWVGPEGGFSAEETEFALQHNALAISLGKRVLRTETAAIASLCLLQAKFGDLN